MPANHDDPERPTERAQTVDPADTRGAIRGPVGPSPPGPWEPFDRIAGLVREIELQLWTIQVLGVVPEDELHAAARQLHELRAQTRRMTRSLPAR